MGTTLRQTYGEQVQARRGSRRATFTGARQLLSFRTYIGWGAMVVESQDYSPNAGRRQLLCKEKYLTSRGKHQ